MRKAFAAMLLELMEQDERIILLTADLGFMVWDAIMEKFPKRFINVGVAEQNMIGIATGLAEAGFIPFVYSIVTFAVLRPYEFIRNGPVFHHLPVRIVGMGGGYEYGNAGPTHHGLEDIGVMRIQPGMTVIAPADSAQASNALRKTYDLPGPIYYRLGKNDNAVVPGLDGRFSFAGLDIIRRGKDLLWIVTGGISVNVAKAAEILAAHNIHTTIAVLASIKPAPTHALAELARQFSCVVTVEAHYKTGGIGSLMAEIIAEQNIHCRLLMRTVSDTHHALSGNENYYDTFYGLDVESLANDVTTFFKSNIRSPISHKELIFS